MDMNYEVKPSREQQGDWIAAAVNDEGDGEMYLVFFSGPDARARAEEYAAWKSKPAKERRPQQNAAVAAHR
jgi:hypothetical protein